LVAETNQERAERYLKMATETAAMAQRAPDPSAAEAYMNLATVWAKMADELVRSDGARDERVLSEREARA